MSSSFVSGPYASAVSMKLTPSSTARRKTFFAFSRSGGQPQIPSPVNRIAPNPSRLTNRSPPNKNISSVEVDGALLRHPAVQEVAIVGMPDQRWGEAPHAFVVLRAGATATETELRNYARDHLAHFKANSDLRLQTSDIRFRA